MWVVTPIFEDLITSGQCFADVRLYKTVPIKLHREKLYSSKFSLVDVHVYFENVIILEWE